MRDRPSCTDVDNCRAAEHQSSATEGTA